MFPLDVDVVEVVEAAVTAEADVLMEDPVTKKIIIHNLNLKSMNEPNLDDCALKTLVGGVMKIHWRYIFFST